MKSARLLLVRHATTPETRRTAFALGSGADSNAAGEALDDAGVAAAAQLRGHLPAGAACFSSFAVRCLQTAEAAGMTPQPDGDLAECDFGAWAGRTPAELHDEDEAGLSQWYADPDTAPHGGECLADVRARAQRVLERAAIAPSTTIAFTHGGFVKAAVLEVFGLPATSVWQIDAAPASITELHRTGDRWRLTRLNWTPAVLTVGVA